jgi:hypothetical protein
MPAAASAGSSSTTAPHSARICPADSASDTATVPRPVLLLRLLLLVNAAAGPTSAVADRIDARCLACEVLLLLLLLKPARPLLADNCCRSSCSC